jgi:5-methylcytosine-specific restriction endonuclease McrA
MTIPDHTTPLKRCTKCGELRPATPEYFRRMSSRPDGLRPNCKICEMGHSRLPPSAISQPGYKRCTRCGRELPSTPEYFKVNRQKASGITQPCRQCSTAGSVAWKRRNPERHSQNSITWKRNHPAYFRIATIRRRTQKRSLPTHFNPSDWDRCLDYWHSRCAYCGNPPGLFHALRLTADHFIPITSPDCLGTIPTNIVPACQSCNSSKNDHDPTEWLTEKLGPRKAKRKLAEIRAYFDSFEERM